MKDLSGTLSINHRQRPGKRDCDRTGVICINGQEFWASGWINTDRETGEKYMQLSFKAKAPRAVSQSQFPTPPAATSDAEGPMPMQQQEPDDVRW